MKKKVLALVLCLVLALTAIGGTLAYFTDTEEATNTFTVGNVDIQLLESKLHREGNGNAGISKEDMSGSSYTDAQIEADAKNYASYLAENGKDIVPGRLVAKCPYVKNTGDNAAYIRIRMIWPAGTANLMSESQYTSSALNSEFTMSQTTESDGTVVVEWVRKDPLAPNTMTYWNVWNYVTLNKALDNENIQTLITAGVVDNDGTLNIKVEADAIQSEGFANATAAWAAFDSQETGNNVESPNVADYSDTVFSAAPTTGNDGE